MKISYKIIIIIFFTIVISGEKLTASEKIKIGLLVPMTGQYQDVGQSIIRSVRLAIQKIDNSNLEILPKDTRGQPLDTLKSAKELSEQGVKIIIGPVFNKNLIYLNELKDVFFISLTNKVIKNPKNIISAGINAESQLRAINKFKKSNNITKTFFLVPNSDFKEEIDYAITQSKIKLKHKYTYDSDPTLLTKQIEKITKYSQRKRNLNDEINRIKNSEDSNKEQKIKNLEKKYTLGGINFDSVIISDFEESLKSVFTSLLYTDVSPKRVYYITLNQWFDQSLLNEKSLQPIYFPSINKENFDEFIDEYSKIYKEKPNQLSFLSYDLVGLVYYLIFKNQFKIDEKIFYEKNKFKGKVGIFEINKNKINHILNFYKVENGEFKKIF